MNKRETLRSHSAWWGGKSRDCYSHLSDEMTESQIQNLAQSSELEAGLRDWIQASLPHSVKDE